MVENDPRMAQTFPLELTGIECVVLTSLIFENMMARRKTRDISEAEIKAYRIMEEIYAKIPKPLSESK